MNGDGFFLQIGGVPAPEPPPPVVEPPVPAAPADGDGDGVGNACDPIDNRPRPVVPPPVVPGPTVADRDRDLVPDASDNCPDAANAEQADRDVDRVGDVCDVSDASAGPSLGKTVVGRVISGDVFVRRPAGSRTRSTGRAAQCRRASPGCRARACCRSARSSTRSADAWR